MSYLLDTNEVVALLKGEPGSFRKRLRRVVSKGATIAVPSVVLYELWYGVEAAGRPIGPYDHLIVAQALRNDATLVTANASEFARVPSLRWENWAAKS